MPPPSIALRECRKSYGSIVALDGVDLTLDSPAILGIAGPNGSGKTTLLRTVLGLERPTSGTATLNGRPARAMPAGTSGQLGYMPQERAIYDDLTVRENVAFFAGLYGVSDVASATDAALAFVDLQARAGSRVSTLSGGMMRRTSLACAVVHDPSLLVLDEPTVGLDPALRESMWAGFRERRGAGDLVLVSTHYLEEVSRCDRVLLLRDGAVLALEEPATLRARTGASDMESAFLALLDGEDGGTGAGPSTPHGVDA